MTHPIWVDGEYLPWRALRQTCGSRSWSRGTSSRTKTSPHGSFRVPCGL